MIDLYTWATHNGRKVSIALEEMGLPYRVHTIDISKDEQFAPDFLAISPNNRIPAIVDADTGLSLFESGAILLYLAEQTGKFIPQTPKEEWKVVEWLMWQMGGVGPMLGQLHHFVAFNPEYGGVSEGGGGRNALHSRGRFALFAQKVAPPSSATVASLPALETTLILILPFWI